MKTLIKWHIMQHFIWVCSCLSKYPFRGFLCTELNIIFLVSQPKLMLWVLIRTVSSVLSPGGYSIFFCIRRLGPSIYRSPKKYQEFQHPKKIFEILANQKNIPILYLDLKKDPKMPRNDPQTSPILR